MTNQEDDSIVIAGNRILNSGVNIFQASLKIFIKNLIFAYDVKLTEHCV
jgi:hypothetical protein